MASRQASQVPVEFVKTTIRMSIEERAKLEALAALSGRSLNNEVRWLIRDAADQYAEAA